MTCSLKSAMNEEMSGKIMWISLIFSMNFSRLYFRDLLNGYLHSTAQTKCLT